MVFTCLKALGFGNHCEAFGWHVGGLVMERLILPYSAANFQCHVFHMTCFCWLWLGLMGSVWGNRGMGMGQLILYSSNLLNLLSRKEKKRNRDGAADAALWVMMEISALPLTEVLCACGGRWGLAWRGIAIEHQCHRRWWVCDDDYGTGSHQQQTEWMYYDLWPTETLRR